MMWIVVLTVLYASIAHVTAYPFSCPAEHVSVKEFRDLTREMDPQEIPTIEQGEKDLKNAPEELQELARPGLLQALELKEKPMHEFSPFIHRCCPKKNLYNCTYASIPLHHIWHRGTFCRVVYPVVPRPVFYVKCTCGTCLRHDSCPLFGRCVETGYKKVGIVAYCPRQSFQFLFVKLSVSVPSQCFCRPSCPTGLIDLPQLPQTLLAEGDEE